MKRREFVTLLCGAAAAWPMTARAQQIALPLVGYLSSLGRNDRPNLAEAFRRGLSEAGYVEGRNVAIEYRFAENRYEQLPGLASDLVGRKVAVIAATGGGNTVLAAKELTTTISDRVPDCWRSCPGGLRHQPQSAGRQYYRDKLVRDPAGR
jgi:putative ABC transport system substrate-binding protein